MRIVIATDSLKGTLSATEACSAIARGLRRFSSSDPGAPRIELVERPLADGGEGSAEVLRQARGGRRRRATVQGPLPDLEIAADWTLLTDGTAVVDSAAASGLALLPASRRDPLLTTTRGTGELILAAASAGAHRICVGAGGSATVDGGAGALTALGWRFLDRAGRPLPPGGGALADLDRIEPPDHPVELPPLEVLCDVRSPLCGSRGAARVFGPQKGASPAAVDRLEAGLERLADHLGGDSRTLAFGGAAGGLAIGLRRLLDAPLLPGAAAIADAVGLHSGEGGVLRGADWVITGEGRLDETSLAGKVVDEVATRARGGGVRVAAIAGRCDLSPETLRQQGIERVETLASAGEPDPSPAEAASRLEAAAARWAQAIGLSQRPS